MSILGFPVRAWFRIDNWICALLFLWLGTASSFTQAQSDVDTFECMFKGEPGAQVSSVAGVFRVPVGFPACEGIKILSEDIIVCYLNELRRSVCSDLRKDDVVDKSALAANADSWEAPLLAFLFGDARFGRGVTRNEELVRPDFVVLGFPYGSVLADQEVVRFDFRLDANAAGVQSLDMITVSDGKLLWENKTVSSSTLDIALAELPEDTWYSWVAHRAGKTPITGTFLLEARSGFDETRDVLRKIDPQLEEFDQFYLRAEIYEKAELYHERDLAMAELKKFVTTEPLSQP